LAHIAVDEATLNTDCSATKEALVFSACLFVFRWNDGISINQPPTAATRPIVKRLFISIPDPLPENLAPLHWRLTGGQPDSGQAATPAELPPGADEIWLVLPAGRVLLSQITLSRRALRQLNGALGNVLEDQLMLDPTGVHVALGKVLPGDVHPVAVLDSAWLEQALTLCRQHGIQPAGAIPETLLWLGNETTETWSARWNGQDGFVRTGAIAGFALDDGAPDMPPLALQLALTEARQRAQPPAAIVLETEIGLDAAAWSRLLDCPVKLQALQPDPHPPAINLLQGEYSPRQRGGGLGSLIRLGDAQHAGKYRLAAMLAIAALSLHVLATFADWARLSWENRKLRDEMRQVFTSTFPQTQTIVDPVLQMQRQLADMRRAHGYVEAGDFLHALTAAGSQVGGVAGLSYDSGRLVLNQPRATDLDGLRGALAIQGYQMAATSGEDGNKYITIERSRP
jgi:type II secretion system protein L